MLDTQGRQRTAERANKPMMIPMSAFEPPWCIMKRGKRKKLLKLDTVNRCAMPIMINEGPYRFEAILDLNLELDLSRLLSKYFVTTQAQSGKGT
jgi:hypothetical protein